MQLIGKGHENWVMSKASPVVFFLSSVEGVAGDKKNNATLGTYNSVIGGDPLEDLG